MLPRSESFRGNRSVACQDSGSASQPPTRPPSPYCCSSRRKPNTLCSGREPRACKCKCIFHSAAMCLVNPQHAKQDTRTGRLSNIKSSTAMFPDRPGQRLQSTPAPPSLHQEIDGIGTQSHVLRRLVPPHSPSTHHPLFPDPVLSSLPQRGFPSVVFAIVPGIIAFIAITLCTGKLLPCVPRVPRRTALQAVCCEYPAPLVTPTYFIILDTWLHRLWSRSSRRCGRSSDVSPARTVKSVGTFFTTLPCCKSSQRVFHYNTDARNRACSPLTNSPTLCACLHVPDSLSGC